jgi:hypothetical protein
LRYTAKGAIWTLYWSDRNGRWHRYDLIGPRPIFARFSTRSTVTPRGFSGADQRPTNLSISAFLFPDCVLILISNGR